MSAVPVPALAFGGTSVLPSSVALILSAKAGPANATIAPSTSVASLVLFDMVFSLFLVNDDSASKQYCSGFIPKMTLTTGNLMEANRSKCGHTGCWIEAGDSGLVECCDD